MRDILEMLSGGGFVSGEKISAELGISRAAVWKRVEALRAQGYAQAEVARRLNVSKATVNLIVHGKYQFAQGA